MTDIVRTSLGTRPPGPEFLKMAREEYLNLCAGKIHPAPCLCPSCLFSEYQKMPRGAGRPFDKETFFLNWLEFEIKVSMIKIADALVCEEFGGRYKEKQFIDLREFAHIRGYIPRLVDFLRKNRKDFSRIKNIDPRRIKILLWRFHRNGVERKLENEIIKRDPARDALAQASAPVWDTFKFAQHVADFIKSRPDRQASSREILRHFSNKKKSDLIDIAGILSGNYRMKAEKKSHSQIFAYRPPSVEKVNREIQEIEKEIQEDERKLFGDEDLG